MNFKKAWHAYCDTHSFGQAPIYDPARHGIDFIQQFFDLLGRNAPQSDVYGSPTQMRAGNSQSRSGNGFNKGGTIIILILLKPINYNIL